MPIYQKSLAAADDIPINSANFPSAAVVFDFVGFEGGFGTVLESKVGNITILGGVGQSVVDGLLVNPIAMLLSAGTLPTLGTKHVFGFHIGKSNTSGGPGNNWIGANPSASVAGFRVNSSGGICMASDGTNTGSSATMLDGGGTAGALQAHACIFERGVAVRASDFDGTTWTDRAAGAGTVPTGTIVLDDNLQIAANSHPALLAWFFFDILPSDAFLKAAVAWSYDRFAKDGSKALYPPLAGL